MKKGIRQRAQEGGIVFVLLVAGGVAALFLTGYFKPIRNLSPVDLPGDTTVVTTPREVGSNFNVTLFCNDPETKVGVPIALTDAPLGGTRYIASRGTEQVNWADSPPGGNDSALHSYFTATGIHVSEGVTITKSAADCIKGKAGKK